MKFLLVGAGAREHAIARALTVSPDVKLVAAGKHRNPGIAARSEDLLVTDESHTDAVVEFAKKHSVDCVVIGPEAPLAAGLADRLKAAHVHVAAPSQAAAEIESSKRFMRELLAKHRIPGNAKAWAFDAPEEAKTFLRREGVEFALKPVGLTGGKGVRVFGDHFRDQAGAAAYVEEVFAQRIGGAGLLIEELLRGEEYTVQCFSDGRRILATPAVQDHKRLLPDDQGPNTGGMGSYSQADGLLPFLPRKAYEESVAIVRRIVEALAAEGRPFVGPIYGQFMLTRDGPRVIEVNARLGDPEAMNTLAILQTPFSDIAMRMAEQRLGGVQPRFEASSTVVKYVVPDGYPAKPVAGTELRVDAKALKASGAELYFANVEKAKTNAYKCGTSRAVAVLGRGETLHHANEQCEAGLRAISGSRLFVRHDIGTQTLLEKRVAHMRLLQAV